MGLLKAGLGAAGGVMADQWKEFIYCESMPADVLACKGSKRTGGRAQRMIASQTQRNCGCHKALHCHIQIPQRKINACGAAGQPGKKQHGKIQQHTGELRHMPFVNEQPVALCQPVGNCRIKRFVRLSKAVPAAPAEKNRRETK